MAKLNWKLLTKKRNSSTQGLPPGKEDLAWVTNTVTLIYGERDAILVDTFLSVQHSKELVDWVAESGKNLTAIYITHAHGDHFFGLQFLLDRFPTAKAFATASTVAGIQSQIDPDFIKSFWEPRFPGQVPSPLVAPEILEGDTLYLEGEELKVIELGHTDASHSTALHVPSIGLVVSGDAVYNDTHPYLAECDDRTRDEWLRALDKIAALDPQAVVAGHGVLAPDSSPRHIAETRDYIRDFNAAAASTSTAVELYEKVLKLHPNRVNPGSLWATAKALKGQAPVSAQEVKMRSTSEVLANHRKCFAARDLDGLLADYADDAVFFTADGAHRGVSAIRAIFEELFREFGKPGVTMVSKQRLVEGDYVHLVWTAETPDNSYELASDTFVIQNGRIQMQQFTARTRSKAALDTTSAVSTASR